MNTFSRGQKGKLSDLGCTSPFTVAVDVKAPGASIDVSCFGLDANDKLSDERYMVFYNQLASPANAVTLDLNGGLCRFKVDLDALPASIAKLVFTAAIDGAAAMRQIAPGSLSVGDAVSFPFTGADFNEEKAIIIAELYRRDGQWRFGAVGQGFNGGLSALLAHFGGSEAAPAAASPAAAPSAAAEAKKISLSKVTLEKRGDKVSLDKRGNKGYGRIRVNLNWNQRPAAMQKTGFFDKLINKPDKGIDLDLACLYEMADGTPGLVQALGKQWGNYDQRPYIQLEGDDRTGSVSTGENIYINGEFFDKIKRALVFAFIYDGVPDWSATDGVVTIEIPDQPPVEVRLDQGGKQPLCAVALIENRGGTLQVTKLIDYFSQQGSTSVHQLLDTKYGFGLRWKTGSKD
ncbi:MAG: tellurium resistance protein [Massilia sp.]|nr:tellurium resistance protein [Massilia sp.]